ncbi:MAG: sulfatase [Pseudomonadota bacterium]|nr:sulfatase [Pseudomonadota bacterium]
MFLGGVTVALIGGALAQQSAAAGIGLADQRFAELAVGRPEAPSAAGTSASLAEDAVAVLGPFRLVGVVGGVRAYEAPIPVRPRALFFDSPPQGMRLVRGTAPLRFAGDAEDAELPGTWDFSADALTVRIRGDAPAPAPGEFFLTYPAARDREDALWRARDEAPAGLEGDTAFVVRSAQVDDVTRRGLYLPVPSTAGWDIAIPADGILRFEAGILPPEMADGTTSDGADVEVRVDGELVATVRARVREFTDVRVPLATWGGRTVRLTLTTADGESTRDHVFVVAPSLYVPRAAPKRTVLVFIDTLRRDHLGVYGHTRGATPGIDRWAEGAVVFDDARSVAPWTLPSSRAALSGMQPEFWADARTLPMRLAAQGWATAAFVGNVYLSSNFDMSGGWGEHGCINWPYARVEVDRTLDFLERHADQDAMVMVHLMDLHLPYKEPSAYRGLYAGERPAGLPEVFNRNTLMSAARGNQESVRNYLTARYDQNLRYVDDQVVRLLDAAGPDATVVLFADHGEEFFDHGGLEHGHTLYDELLRIPLVVRAPGLTPRRVTTPVSLVDLTPTVLELLGLADPELQGRSLVPVARGDLDPTLAERPIAFGRPLYGNEAWGSVAAGLKYISRSGEELLFDLQENPEETKDLRADLDPAPARASLGVGLGRGVGVGYRLSPRGRGSSPFKVEMHVPGGIAMAWVGDDPTNMSAATVEAIDDETIAASFTSMRGTHREVFVVPKGDAPAIAPTVTVRLAQRNVTGTALKPLPFDGAGKALARLSSQGRSLEVTYAALPLPAGDAAVGADDEQNAVLEALGYVEDADPGDAGGESPDSTLPRTPPRSHTP